MKDWLVFALFEVSVIELLVIIFLFLFLKKERSRTTRLLSLAKKMSHGREDKKKIFTAMADSLRKELITIAKAEKAYLSEPEASRDSDMLSVLNVREALVKAELSMIEGVDQGKPYDQAVKESVGTLIERLEHLFAATAPDDERPWQDLSDAVNPATDHEPALMTMFDKLEQDYQKELQNNSELLNRINVLERELVETQNASLNTHFFGEIESSNEEIIENEPFIDATDKLIEKINHITFKRDQIANDYQLLEERYQNDEQKYQQRMSKLEQEKQALLALQKIENIDSENKKENNKKLKQIETEQEIAVSHHDVMVRQMDARRQDYTQRIAQLETEKQALKDQIDTILKSKDKELDSAKKFYLKKFKEEKSSSDEHVAKIIEKMNKVFEYNQKNSLQMEETLREKDDIIAKLKKKCNAKDQKIEDAVKGVSDGYANLLKQKDSKIKKLQKKVATLSDIITTMKK